MKTIKNLQRLQRIHGLIESECTGSPKELADRMHISERLVYHLLEQLRDYDAPIRYDRSRKTYYYDEDFHLWVDISVAVRSNNELTKVYGGGGEISD